MFRAGRVLKPDLLAVMPQLVGTATMSVLLIVAGLRIGNVTPLSLLVIPLCFVNLLVFQYFKQRRRNETAAFLDVVIVPGENSEEASGVDWAVASLASFCCILALLSSFVACGDAGLCF